MITDASPVSVRLASEQDLASWQTFVDASLDAGALHHAGWFGVMRDAYAVRPYFFIAHDAAGSVCGVMPGYESRGLFAGAHYTTLEGGALARDAAARDALVARAKAFRGEPGLKFVQIRGGDIGETAPVSLSTVQTIVPTANGVDAAFAAIKTKTRWAVRQAEKQELEVSHDPDLRGLESFYALYAAHMHTLGTPVFGARTFRAMREHLAVEKLRLYLVRYRGSLVGGMLCIVHGDRWTDLYAVVRRSQSPEFTNYLLYWHVIRDAALSGIRQLNLGRSTPGGNVHLFKRKWGGVDIEVPYYFYPASGYAGRKMGLLDANRSKGLAQRIWSKTPLSLCNVVGPIIRRQLPFL